MWLIDANRLYDAAEEKYMEDRSKTDNVITRAMLRCCEQTMASGGRKRIFAATEIGGKNEHYTFEISHR